ncbi:MAG TPA: tetratricopeptide repeat protein, partial [Verrucomicrobiae bacterium]|nr:tetratricopeptide repeat protein [Verrucomicrobiae bacterium]
MKSVIKPLAMLILLLICPCGTNAQNIAVDISSAFDAANRLYEQSKFAEAASAYEKLVQNGAVSPALCFNLGNAFFKASQVGRAIAAYRQAERLTPRDPDVRA